MNVVCSKYPSKLSDPNDNYEFDENGCLFYRTKKITTGSTWKDIALNGVAVPMDNIYILKFNQTESKQLNNIPMTDISPYTEQINDLEINFAINPKEDNHESVYIVIVGKSKVKNQSLNRRQRLINNNMDSNIKKTIHDHDQKKENKLKEKQVRKHKQKQQSKKFKQQRILKNNLMNANNETSKLPSKCTLCNIDETIRKIIPECKIDDQEYENICSKCYKDKVDQSFQSQLDNLSGKSYWDLYYDSDSDCYYSRSDSDYDSDHECPYCTSEIFH